MADTQGFVEGLSELELALLICAARVEVKLEADTVNFNLVYDEYVQMANLMKQDRTAAMSDLSSGAGTVIGYRIWSKDLARSSWERLEVMNLIISLSSGGASAGTSVQDEIKMVKVDASLLELSKMIDSQHILKKWTRL